jgi:23S rRNA (uridine2552-2'-O)-methyltransferase
MSQSLDSSSWMKRHVNDEYVKKARYENYRARSAFKLLEIDAKHHLIRPGNVVIDLGASPGSWTQAATRLMGLSRDLIKGQRVK